MRERDTETERERGANKNALRCLVLDIWSLACVFALVLYTRYIGVRGIKRREGGRSVRQVTNEHVIYERNRDQTDEIMELLTHDITGDEVCLVIISY